MKQDILALGLGVSAIFLWVGQLHAQGVTRSAERAAIVERLAETYGDTR